MATKKYINLSNLSVFLDGLKTKFAALTHTHSISEITDYTVDNALSPDSENPVQNKVLDAEFEAISTAMNAIESAVDTKLNSADYVIDSELSDTSENPVKNSVIKTELDAIKDDFTAITTAEIDEICGNSIVTATLDNEVTF